MSLFLFKGIGPDKVRDPVSGQLYDYCIQVKGRFRFFFNVKDDIEKSIEKFMADTPEVSKAPDAKTVLGQLRKLVSEVTYNVCLTKCFLIFVSSGHCLGFV